MAADAYRPPVHRRRGALIDRATLAMRAMSGSGAQLAVPLMAITLIVALAVSLLYGAHVFERSRQSQRLIADTLWAEQAMSFEVARMTEGLRFLPRDVAEAPPLGAPPGGVDDRVSSVLQRHRALLSVVILSTQDVDPVAGRMSGLGASTGAIRDLVERSRRLNAPTSSQIDHTLPGDVRMLLAVPAHARTDRVTVAAVSLTRLLQNTVPWWLAHNARITLDNSAGDLLAQRDANVVGRGVYTHKLATTFVDRTLYLRADSTQGTPFLIPNLMAVSILILSAVSAWTVWELWRDLQRRTRAESALLRQQALQAAMEQALVVGLRACDMQGRITYANPAYCAMVGYSLEELRLMPPVPLLRESMHDDPPPAPSRTAGPDGLDGHTTHEGQVARRAGDVLDVLMHEAPLLDGQGLQIGWMASVHDITEQRRNADLLHSQEVRIQRMARLMTMGEMASALAHELNQPLAAATSYITAGINLVNDPQSQTDLNFASEYFAKARAQTRRAGEIIKRVRQFVGHSVPVLQPLRLDEVVRDLVPLIRLQVVDDAAPLKLFIATDLPAVLADRVLLEQIVLNLTRNAFEAVQIQHADHRQVELRCELADDGATICVRDRGPGLGRDAVAILSSALSSSKAGGLGMGLAICRKAAELLGTRLQYRPRAGGGAEFWVSLRTAPRAN